MTDSGTRTSLGQHVLNKLFEKKEERTREGRRRESGEEGRREEGGRKGRREGGRERGNIKRGFFFNFCAEVSISNASKRKGNVSCK